MLKEIQENLNTQDNRATANPIFIVYDWERIPSHSDYTDKFMFVDNEGKIAENREDLIAFLEDNDCCGKLPKEELKEMDDNSLIEWIKENGFETIDKVYYIKKRVFINIFFTEKAANDFIKQNHYHYTKDVHTYVACLWRNPEMQYIRKCLKEGLFKDINAVKSDGNI